MNPISLPSQLLSLSHSVSQRIQYSESTNLSYSLKTQNEQSSVVADLSHSRAFSFSYSSAGEQAITYNANGVQEGAEVSHSANKTQAASNILTFIDAQLQRDVADGADSEALTSRLKAGLDGFLTGFNEAYTQLADTGLLSDEVKVAVQKTYNDVMSGVDQLAEKLGMESPVSDELRMRFGNTTEAKVTPDEALVTKEADELVVETKDQKESSIIQADMASFRERMTLQSERAEQRAKEAQNSTESAPSFDVSGLNYNHTEKRSFDFQLRTTDGDIVTINLYADREDAIRYENGEDGEQYSISRSQSGDFIFEVDGELDADELNAINELLSQIGDVTETFFEGDVFDAFEKALAVGFDSEQILGFSLNLRKEQIAQVETTYQTVAQLHQGESQQQDKPFDIRDHRMAQLSDFIKMLEDIRVKADGMGIERETVTETIDYMAREKYGDGEKVDKARGFFDNLLSDLEKLKQSEV